MNDSSHTTDNNRPAFRAPFQADMLDHWHQIRNGQRFPRKRDFRPQMFPKFLPQLAIVSVTEKSRFQDRLIGTTICEVLKLTSPDDRLIPFRDAKINQTLTAILEASTEHCEPLYFEGQFMPDDARPIPFSALVLPFSQEGEPDSLSSLLLAFDFVRTPETTAPDTPETITFRPVYSDR
ncbi:PAS domain-containing protein [Kordiimonas marina]|uniref:PAS domain-containing protein n=1 Tax=Kordiimonas marina TaxID=2872312 RepID=UPI001FF6B1F9|nr:PAS domain-containing protein [Kordiimonas marina]MCJ9430247.1 PAS domain-containing protein [Kordiimonas marina]